MSGAPLQIALLVKADVSSGKGALEEFRASVAKTGAEARALAPALDQAGRAVSGVSTSAERAGQSILQVPTKVRVVSDAALAAAVSAVAGFGRLDQAAASRLKLRDYYNEVHPEGRDDVLPRAFL